MKYRNPLEYGSRFGTRSAFALSISEGARLARKAQADGRIEDAAGLDADCAKFRHMRFRNWQMRLAGLALRCPDFATEARP